MYARSSVQSPKSFNCGMRNAECGLENRVVRAFENLIPLRSRKRKCSLIILAAEIAPCFHNAMAEQGPGNTKSARRRPKSDVLTKRQAAWVSGIVAVGILSVCILYWNGFPVGETIGPMIV